MSRPCRPIIYPVLVVAVCYPKWSRYEHTAASGGQPVFLTSIKYLPSCLESCLNASDCIGIEWSSLPGSESGVCSVYNSSQKQNFTNVVIRPFVTQYRLLNRCETCKTILYSLELSFVKRFCFTSYFYDLGNNSYC